MKTTSLLVVLGFVLVLAAPALADWDPADPYKWVQYPDLTANGIDVNATADIDGGNILADDFECTVTGPITDIHIWGSWKGDYIPWGDDPRAVTFTLSIHKDIPDSESSTGYSMPGDVLWYRTFQPGDFTARIWSTGIQEGWMDPPDMYWPFADTTCWQYNFFIDPELAFHQQGTADEPVVYWLDVQAIPQDPQALFGWKTSRDHWNDDGVYGWGLEPYTGTWGELRYPPGHEQVGQSIDLAFVITGETQIDLDWGDAPDNAGAPGYPTLSSSGGANHIISGPWLGDANDLPDAEADGQPDPNALGDDNSGNDDENGVLIPILTPGQSSTITLTVSGSNGAVEAWIDFNSDKIWQGTEMIHNATLAPGDHSFNITTPLAAVPGQTFARFRISTNGGLAPGGPAQDGEVEDYEVYIEELDWGDAPDGAAAPGYPTYSWNNGANHVIAGPWLGDMTDVPDHESNGQPDLNALGDDNDGNDDEDGVQIPTLIVGVSCDITLEVNSTGGAGGVVEAWVDFNGDQNWVLAEQIFAGWLPDGVHTISVTAPAGSVLGQTFARFRISGNGGLTPGGFAPDGEVEDYEVYIEEEQVYKWIQPPDLTVYGIDVNATEDFILADDFECTQPGYITDIGVWASWKYDYLPYDNPEAVIFTLSIHADIPDSESTTGYSMPGDMLWMRTFHQGEFSALVWDDNVVEGWMDPPDGYIFPADYVCWLYKFPIEMYEGFFQAGTVDSPIVYWLDVQARPDDIEALFGWKTARTHWNDDAVWGQGQEPHAGPWYELRYPPGHEQVGQSIDLAFRIRSENGTGADSEIAPPARFGLYQNVPNPFNPATEILYELHAGGHVTLEVFSVRGRLVRTLVDAAQDRGPHTAVWDGRDAGGQDLSSGVYFYRLRTDGIEETRKMLLLK